MKDLYAAYSKSNWLANLREMVIFILHNSHKLCEKF